MKDGYYRSNGLPVHRRARFFVPATVIYSSRAPPINSARNSMVLAKVHWQESMNSRNISGNAIEVYITKDHPLWIQFLQLDSYRFQTGNNTSDHFIFVLTDRDVNSYHK